MASRFSVRHTIGKTGLALWTTVVVGVLLLSAGCGSADTSQATTAAENAAKAAQEAAQAAKDAAAAAQQASMAAQRAGGCRIHWRRRRSKESGRRPGSLDCGAECRRRCPGGEPGRTEGRFRPVHDDGRTRQLGGLLRTQRIARRADHPTVQRGDGHRRPGEVRQHV